MSQRQAVRFRDSHVQQLPPAHDQRRQQRALFVRQSAQVALALRIAGDDVREVPQDPRIDERASTR